MASSAADILCCGTFQIALFTLVPCMLLHFTPSCKGNRTSKSTLVAHGRAALLNYFSTALYSGALIQRPAGWQLLDARAHGANDAASGPSGKRVLEGAVITVPNFRLCSMVRYACVCLWVCLLETWAECRQTSGRVKMYARPGCWCLRSQPALQLTRSWLKSCVRLWHPLGWEKITLQVRVALFLLFISYRKTTATNKTTHTHMHMYGVANRD